jgi:hypothetical protein
MEELGRVGELGFYGRAWKSGRLRVLLENLGERLRRAQIRVL